MATKRKPTQGERVLDAMRTLAHAYRYIEREQPTFAGLHTSEYWSRQRAAMHIMTTFYAMAKELTMHAFMTDIHTCDNHGSPCVACDEFYGPIIKRLEEPNHSPK